MPRFKRLTDEQARTLTRAQLLARVEAEQAYWQRRPPRTETDRAARREFGRIMHAYLDPLAAMQDLTDALQAGRRSTYWQSRPCDDADQAEPDPAPVTPDWSPPPVDPAVLAYARMALSREPEAE